MLNTPCPYCHHPEMPAPEPGHNPHATCANCGLRPRAKLTHQIDGAVLVSYVAESLPRLDLAGVVPFRPTKKQAAYLSAQPNRSEAIRAALDAWIDSS